MPSIQVEPRVVPFIINCINVVIFNINVIFINSCQDIEGY